MSKSTSSRNPTHPVNSTFSPDQWLSDHGDALYAYAFLRLRSREAAEDIVQETLLAAWRSRNSFAGNAAERTWLIGILKHKLADHWRRNVREPQAAGSLDGDDELIEYLFDSGENNHWRTAPSPWNDPEAALEQQEFWQILTDCVAALPPAQAQAFSLCEIDGLDGADACKVLAVAPTNLWVMLHRARLRLRQCLERNWFGRRANG